ncbi:hypothetical protein ACFLYL_02300, partial [Chloroflexota bacterium]
MAQHKDMPEEELARKANAIRLLSLGLLATAVTGEVTTIVIWFINPMFLIIPVTMMFVAVMLVSSITYYLGRSGRVKAAGYFFVICLTLLSAIITTLFGGFIGPYIFCILVACMVISINAGYLIATLATILYLVMTGVEQAGLL